MNEMTIEATVANIETVTDFVNEQLEALSKETGLSPGQLSIAWMTRPGSIPVVPIIGAHTPEQLTDSLAGAEAVIGGEIAARYDLFRRDRI